MGRRRKNALLDVLALAAALPWQLAVVLVPITFVALRTIAMEPPATPTGWPNLAGPIIRGALHGAAIVGQFAVPALLAVGAILAYTRRAHAGRLVNSLGSPLEGDDDLQMPKTWREFETLVGEIYRRQGYDVTKTPEGADGGIDLVLGRGTERFLIQCKHWQARKIDVKVVREFNGVIAAEGAAGGAVVTSGNFTRDAMKFATGARIDLVDGRRLQVLAQQLAAGQCVAKEPQRPAGVENLGGRRTGASRHCPTCGSEMVLRTAKRGPNSGQQFWGCRTYPKCRGTRAHSANDPR